MQLGDAMTRLTITDPSEGCTYSGYYSIEIEEHGEVLADIRLAPELMPDLNDPADIAEFGEALQQAAEVAEDIEDA